MNFEKARGVELNPLEKMYQHVEEVFVGTAERIIELAEKYSPDKVISSEQVQKSIGLLLRSFSYFSLPFVALGVREVHEQTDDLTLSALAGFLIAASAVISGLVGGELRDRKRTAMDGLHDELVRIRDEGNT